MGPFLTFVDPLSLFALVDPLRIDPLSARRGFGELSGAFFQPAAGKKPSCGQSLITPKFHNYTFGVAQNAEPNSWPWTVFLCLKGKFQN
jgi:hypothetical protein